MTVIAWDGRTLAADKQATVGNMVRTATKILRVGAELAALAGDANHALALLAWYRGARDPREYPRGDNGDDCGDLFIFGSGNVRIYSGKGYGYPETIEGPFVAFGSGRDFALAAMHLGRNAAEAVAVACAFDAFCGQGIDTLELCESRNIFCRQAATQE